MRLDHWIDRLTAELSGQVLDVRGTAELAIEKLNTPRTPAIWVAPVHASAARGSGVPMRQRVTARVAVVMVVRNARDATGETGHQALETLRDAVLSALFGWTPPDAEAGAHYVRGRLIDFTASTLWWQDEFETDYWLREV